MASLNQIITIIEKRVADLKARHEKLDATFWDRSDRWQESEKGEEFQDKVNELEAVIDCFDEALDELREFQETHG